MVDCSDLELEESWIMTAAPWRWGVSLLILSEFYHILMVGACYQWQPLIHCLISSSLIRLVHNIVQEQDVVMSTEQYNQNCDLNQDWFYFNSQRITGFAPHWPSKDSNDWKFHLLFPGADTWLGLCRDHWSQDPGAWLDLWTTREANMSAQLMLIVIDAINKLEKKPFNCSNIPWFIAHCNLLVKFIDPLCFHHFYNLQFSTQDTRL